MDRRDLLAAGLAGPLLPLAARAVPHGPLAPDASINLWPGEAPGLLDRALQDHVAVRSADPGFPDRAMDHVRTPRLDIFRATQPNGAAMLVIPGGGYARVVVDKEGYELGPWLAARGITAFVLFYRLPGDPWRDPSNVALADAQRAMRLIRSRAAEWQVDPERVGAMGFSAGGHLCADLAARFGRKLHAPIDAADALDARPIVAAPIYPVVSMDPGFAHMGSRTLLIGKEATPGMATEHSPERQVGAHTPPCFLCHAEDDATVPIQNTIALRAALKAAGVPVETHLFEQGGHGFGWGPRTLGRPAHAWPELFLAWARGHGLLG
ncbi:MULTISPECIES: alpha/beta hydrolase [Sphingomonas]|uniref:Acetyl esterase/lipase n=1 Tax=Sphingomonas leidyi TaxID=68569 RepID=A0A7X5ZWX6_9SPHN|nr:MULTISPECIES: alpha/beta hydrolase [Sphingomonas]MBN8812404.1 alpha/beta hydrolase [Sphingomonas sp.]NIJ66675.1 acetyl esterase/lipase [Sphingomonas leidyi]OJY49011.1 MAG: alpha/beta hydrolase [Sphingomonas sp. 67-41]